MEQGSSKAWRQILALSGRRTADVKQHGARKREFSKQLHLFWFSLFTLTFLYVIFYFYFWLVAWNRFDDLNWKLYLRVSKWIPWYNIILGLTCATFAYFTIFMCVFLSLVLQGRQPYIHPVHVLVTVLTLASCITVTVGVDKIWRSEWTTALMSLKVTGPFLQIGLVVLLTVFSWFLVSTWLQLQSSAAKVLCLLVYVGVMLVLYTCPLYINSPCVTDTLPPKPKVLAHRGASAILPENTLLAYKNAYEFGVWGVESDVQISTDCVPFILHDRSLVRTTNVRDVFPDRAHNDASTFTMAELKSLNAGNWFLDTDPWGSAGDLNGPQKSEAAGQTIPTLEELSLLASNYDDSVFMFDLYYPPENHPCYNRSVNITIDAITKAGFPLDRLLWLEGTFHGSRPTGVNLVGEDYLPVSTLRKQNIAITNVQHIELTDSNIREYQSSNISINIWVINAEWFYSLYWCMGITSVTSDRSHALTKLHAPSWHMVPSTYLPIWITVDVLSAALIIAVTLIQIKRLRRASFTF